ERAHSMALAYENRADAHPEAVAIEAGERQLTYAQLDEFANRLAHHLRTLGLRRDDIVGIVAERGLEMIVAALGTLKAGAAYSPMDPDNPTLRTQQQLKDARARIVVAPTHLAERFLATGLSVVALDPNWQALANENARRPELKIAPTDLCAVLFTSGSTGR